MGFVLSRKKEPKNVLVFDFGGANCEVSYLPYADDRFGYSIRAHKEKQDLGGRQITSLIVEHCIKEIGEVELDDIV